MIGDLTAEGYICAWSDASRNQGYAIIVRGPLRLSKRHPQPDLSANE